MCFSRWRDGPARTIRGQEQSRSFAIVTRRMEMAGARGYDIIMNKDLLIRRLVSLKPELNAEGVSHLALFGSRARGDHSSQSDIDLLLEVEPASRFSILNLVGVEQIVEREMGMTANAFMRRSLDREFKASIEDDVIEVF